MSANMCVGSVIKNKVIHEKKEQNLVKGEKADNGFWANLGTLATCSQAA